MVIKIGCSGILILFLKRGKNDYINQVWFWTERVYFSSYCFLTISAETGSLSGLHHSCFCCLNTPFWPVLRHKHTHRDTHTHARTHTHAHTNTNTLNAGSLSCQESTSSAQQLGPQDSLWVCDGSNTNSHFKILFCSMSPTEETFKRSGPLGRPHSSPAPLFLPRLSRQSWQRSRRSRWSTETSHHRSLTGAEQLGGLSQVFLTRPVPESHSAAGRLEPFVTLPVRAWLWLTGDGRVKQVSCPIQKRRAWDHSVERDIIFMTAGLDIHQSNSRTGSGPDVTWVGSHQNWPTEDAMQVNTEGDKWIFLYCSEHEDQEFAVNCHQSQK